MKSKVIEQYRQGFSCLEIAQQQDLCPRTVQRWVKKEGIMRGGSETFTNAIKRGRMKYFKKPKSELKQRKRVQDKVRYAIFRKYGFKCCKCGNTASEARIQIDHIDENPCNNNIDNLQVLCEPCNRGKHWNNV